MRGNPGRGGQRGKGKQGRIPMLYLTMQHEDFERSFVDGRRCRHCYLFL